jgi:hypothetical protein
LLIHTYAPRTVPIDVVDDDIVENLERAWAPDCVEDSPLRPEIDLITMTPDGRDLWPRGLADELTRGFAAISLRAERDRSYTLHPSTAGARWSERWPGQVASFEVRRDLITEWQPFLPKAMRPDQIDPIATVIAQSLGNV